MIKNLPQGWRVEKLATQGKFIRGVSYGKEDLFLEENSNSVILLRANNIQDNLYINDVQFVNKKCVKEIQLLRKGDILISTSSGSKHLVGKNIFIAETIPNTTFGAFCSVFRVKDPLRSNYFSKFFQSTNFKNSLSLNGANINNLRISELEDIEIPLPPLPQQEKIVKVLDNSASLVEQQKQLIEKYDVFLKSKFIEMFGDPITNPMEWEIQKFDNIFTKITDGTHNSPPMSNSGYKYITAKHIKENKIDFERDETYISEEEHKKIFSRCSPKKGDILYIKDGATTGIACINTLEEEFSLLSSVALLKPSVKIKSEYIVSYLNNPTVKLDILQNMVGGAIKRLTIQKIKNLTIPMPPIELQNKFASIVEKIEAIKAKETQKLSNLETLHVSLMDKAFKGEIV